MPLLARTLRGATLLVIWSLAAATTRVAPPRPFSDDEILALAVSQSKAIVIAHVLQVRDSVIEWPSIIEGASPAERTRLSYTDLTLRPIRWLKGPQGPADLHVGTFMLNAALTDIPSLYAGDVVGVFFLRRAARGWMISDYPAEYNKGRLVRLDRPTDDTAETRAIEAMVARQSLDSLLLRADLVVLGHRVSLRHPYPYRGVRVDSVLAGCAPTDTILVASRFSLAVKPGPAVYFLSRVSPTQYEILDFRAGCDPVRADTLARLGIPLRQVFQRAAELRPRREERGGTQP